MAHVGGFVAGFVLVRPFVAWARFQPRPARHDPPFRWQAWNGRASNVFDRSDKPGLKNRYERLFLGLGPVGRADCCRSALPPHA